ncbi:arabinan endo-1,5-alpha-L-arabinosidase [Altericroceibacterium spongiae]|uniref:Extracellular exo-alpha-(1->5)-L-arabinofuranosidase n=1 Tax=Altericroceibacterium spongiae TaxID=2320269 RepID=A0A420EAC8_9SPHN|nr:arabinan endo-1,5-alpha-L-arabinosidase [Altericroceibacterium spongiae]RKF17647.1 arabinan endo-1,5-alpha-L-arabinosidase [Altericroceibacterium spongiae]
MPGLRTRSHFSPSAAGALLFGAALLSGCAAPFSSSLGETAIGGLHGDIAPVHDPAILQVDGQYVMLVTSHRGSKYAFLPVRTSHNLREWYFQGPVLKQLPDWAVQAVPGVSGIWAPDIRMVDGQTRLYYSLSRFGKNRSTIGLLTNDAFDPKRPDKGWQDRGPIISSSPDDDFNAIDPNLLVDETGRHWLTFGSFWSGIKLIELDPATGLVLPDAPLHALARRGGEGAIEAPFLFHHDHYYYLFASFDRCCRGVKSSYNVRVGRSRSVTGPYRDRDGRDMMQGGGSLVLSADLEPDRRFKGPGHQAILRDGARDLIVYHAYDARNDGAPTLRIQRLDWSEDGWPIAHPLDNHLP